MIQSRDVRDEASVMMFMGSFQETLGLPDILVNCAGIGCSKPFVETRFEDFDNVVKTDLYETFFFCREFVRRGQGKLGGKIINVTSVHQAIPSRGNPSLRRGKRGLLTLTRSLAMELPNRGSTSTPLPQG
ncbi:SDR family NAD(P)-dependent oxidoreductase [Rhizobium leguminosarum]|jgi:glucose 1-dehydrogenase|uniref:SDR family NAD(P)-dependent oxidoreductase n=1 Tax=Rhizobium leguminosarum TaxID=384 RepID=UPI0024797700|nr:SDR family oxidoreductase [Rhizobium leguminosarum]